MARSGIPSPAVAEIQGLYGPFTFSEKLLQQIWARGDFDRARLVTTSGQRVQVVYPGRWNGLGGPDFKQARLRLGEGPEMTGDVELHLHAGDWVAHRHAEDAAYSEVRLHVVLFPPEAGQPTIGANGREIPVVVLLPLLHCDLEEYAAEAAVEHLAGRPVAQILEVLRGLPPDELGAELRIQSERRWRQKVHYAQLRIGRLGWEGACHHAALEILGYRFNRSPMLRIASAHPLKEWAESGLSAEAIFAEETWSLQGVRPANHPRTRLRQYAAWVTQVPDWPQQMARLADTWPNPEVTERTAEVRQAHRLTRLRHDLAERLAAGQIGGTRWNNLVCDGCLPLLTARNGRNLCGLWHHWFPGDLPPVVTRALRELGVFALRSDPACHGLAQGLLVRFLAESSAGA
jgi:hypothetical protein